MSFTARKSFIEGNLSAGDDSSNYDYIVPAFIDIHCHGGGGKSFSENADTARNLHLKNGTKTQFASLVSQDIETLINQIKTLKSADIYGIHLEGPYLSRQYCGAHDPHLLRTPTVDELKRLIEVGEGAIKMVTIAPELPNAIDVIKYLVNQNVLVAIGHSAAKGTETKMAIDAGAKVVTHFNNGMAKYPAKDSLAEVVLKSDLYLELILDRKHIPDEISKEVLRIAPDRSVAITDSMAAAGSPDGEYKIGNLEVTVKDKVAKLKGTETLAGSTLTMLDAFFNLLALSDFETAVRCTSLNAAKLLGINPYKNYIGIKNRDVTHLSL